jgi:hypothetical protein
VRKNFAPVGNRKSIPRSSSLIDYKKKAALESRLMFRTEEEKIASLPPVAKQLHGTRFSCAVNLY